MGWGLVLATPPSPDLVIVVKRENGKSGRLGFYSQAGWKGALTYFGNDSADSEQGVFAPEQVRALRDAMSQ